MHSWIFRNRERLRVLFGLELPPLPDPIVTGLAELVDSVVVDADDFFEAEEKGTPVSAEEPFGESPAGPGSRIPGTFRRTSRYVVLQPMTPPRRAA